MQQVRQSTAARQQPRVSAPPGARPNSHIDPRANPRGNARRAQSTAVPGRPPRGSAIPGAAPRAGAVPKQQKPRRQADKVAVKRKKKAKDPNRVKLLSFQGRVDVPMFVIIMVLLVFGITMMFSAGHALSYRDNGGDSFYYVTRQMIAAGIGLVGMFFLTFLDYRFLRYEFKIFGGRRRITVTHLLLVFTMALNLLTIPFGIRAEGGQKRWLPLPGLGQFQPSDLMKIAVIVYFAYYIQKHSSKMRTFRDGILIPGLVLMMIILSVISQMHLSLFMIICLVFAAMLFMGGTNLKYFVPLVLLAVAAVYVVIFVLDIGYFQDRFIYMDPLSQPGDGSYQNYQSALALGSGGMWGKGFGNSSQKYYYLPEAQNDFVFAVLVEEFGLVGGLAVIVLFLIFVFRGFLIARKAEDKFGCLLATGITFQIGIQAFLNLGVNLCCIPNTGISMPFFSYGGTALMFQLFEMGLLLSVSKRAKLS